MESRCAMVGLFGDDLNDYMAKCGAKQQSQNNDFIDGNNV